MLADAVHWLLNMRPFAEGAATRAGKALPILKDISTLQTPERPDNEPFSLGRCRPCNMRKMFIDLFFPDSHRLGEFPGTHLLVTEEDHHLLTNRLHVKALKYYRKSTFSLPANGPNAAPPACIIFCVCIDSYLTRVVRRRDIFSIRLL